MVLLRDNYCSKFLTICSYIIKQKILNHILSVQSYSTEYSSYSLKERRDTTHDIDAIESHRELVTGSSLPAFVPSSRTS